MKIVKYSKKRCNIYNIVLEDNSIISLYEDVILHNNLLITKEINDGNFNNIMEENKFYECYYSALKIINARLRSSYEVELKLINKDFSKDIISNVINKLINEGYINDLFFAIIYVNESIITTYHGPKRIYSDLKKKKVKDDYINKALESFDSNIEKDKINKIINKYSKSNRSSSNSLLKLKIKNNLIKDGYSSNIINSILNDFSFNDDNLIREKEKEKAIKKYSSKYSGFELDMKVREYLYRKGF